MPLALEVLADKDACNGAEDEAEQRADTEEEEPDQGSRDAADGRAHGAPVARPEAAGAVGGGYEVGDERERGENEEDHEDRGPDGLKVREDGVEEGRKEYERNAGQTRQDASQQPHEHQNEGEC